MSRLPGTVPVQIWTDLYLIPLSTDLGYDLPEHLDQFMVVPWQQLGVLRERQQRVQALLPQLPLLLLNLPVHERSRNRHYQVPVQVPLLTPY